MGKFDLKEITINDRELINNYFLKNNIVISEYTFTNLFIWRNSRRIKFSEFNSGLVILAETANERFFMPPVGFENDKEIISFLIDYGTLNSITQSVKRVSKLSLNHFTETGLKITEDRNNFDYVYLSHDLAFLKGRKYSSKRNFITNFLSEYNYSYVQYESKYYEDCIKLAELWITKKEHHGEYDESIHNEFHAIKELLTNFDNLNAKGGLLFVDGVLEAFAFGEKLNDKTFVIHFEKANFELKGIYQVINKLFIEHEVEGKFEFVNREQDLGIHGIRKAKESYFPVEMIEKYTISAN